MVDILTELNEIAESKIHTHTHKDLATKKLTNISIF